jgi:hypothetical protein
VIREQPFEIVLHQGVEHAEHGRDAAHDHDDAPESCVTRFERADRTSVDTRSMTPDMSAEMLPGAAGCASARYTERITPPHAEATKKIMKRMSRIPAPTRAEKRPRTKGTLR